jgi:hypothetical protein
MNLIDSNIINMNKAIGDCIHSISLPLDSLPPVVNNPLLAAAAGDCASPSQLQSQNTGTTVASSVGTDH